MAYEKDSYGIEVANWPRSGKTTTISLDKRIFPDRTRLETYLQRRYGDGKLIETDSGSFEYRRTTDMPPLLKRLGAFLLNKSYR